MKKRSICFVTNELYPLGPGGIGRMMFNFAKQNAAAGHPAELHFLVPPNLVQTDEDRRRLDNVYIGLAEVHVATPLHALPDHNAHLMDRASLLPWSLGLLWSTSYRFYRELLAIETRRGSPFDIIEFPDFGGWGFAAIEAKRAGLAFQNTTLAARLHSTQGVISRAERFFDPSYWNGLLMDSEAHLLRHADLIVGHEQFVVGHNQDHYDLAERWQDRVVLEFPPIVLDDIELARDGDLGTGNGADTNFIFSSRLQRFKRPDIFIRAAIAFAEKHPDHKGLFRIVSYGWDQPYIDWLDSLVPDNLRDRVQTHYTAAPKQRIEWLQDSVIVIPSDYESLCLFAYEASQMGSSVILNRACGVFGQGARWDEGQNCLMFDGSVEDLVASMEQSLDWAPSAKVSIESDRPYWEASGQPVAPEPAEPASVSLVGFGYRTKFELEQHFSSLAMLAAAPILQNTDINRVLIIPSAIYDASAEIITRASAQGWEIQKSSGVEECPETLRKRLTNLPSDAVLLCQPGYVPQANFIDVARKAMGQTAGPSIVGGLLEEIDAASGASQTMRVYGGEMPSQALMSSRIAPISSLFRKSLFERHPFDPRACNQWFEVFIRECALDEEQIVIAPMVAATLAGEALYRIETTKKLSAGIFDKVGLDAGLKARLIAIEPLLPNQEAVGRKIPMPVNTLQEGKMLAPLSVSRNFRPVQFLPDHQGLMVHPLKDAGITMAEISGPYGCIARFSVDVIMASQENDGAEVAVVCAPPSASPEDIEAIMNSRDCLPKGYAAGGWHQIAHDQPVTLFLGLRGASRGKDRLILLSRLNDGGGEANSQVVFHNCVVEYDSNIF